MLHFKLGAMVVAVDLKMDGERVGELIWRLRCISALDLVEDERIRRLWCIYALDLVQDHRI